LMVACIYARQTWNVLAVLKFVNSGTHWFAKTTSEQWIRNPIFHL
jgi:hypothetical protein